MKCPSCLKKITIRVERPKNYKKWYWTGCFYCQTYASSYDKKRLWERLKKEAQVQISDFIQNIY
jgi:hypothetical protein